MFSIRLLPLFIILINPFLHSQQLEAPAAFNTTNKIISFADFLFCSGDYFRAALEYQRVHSIINNDTLVFKEALGYSYSGNFPEARNLMKSISSGSVFYENARLEYFKMYLLDEKYDQLISETGSVPEPQMNTAITKMLYSGMLLKNSIPIKEGYSSIFADDQEMLQLYERRANPDSRNPFLAGILSAILPGSGKVYTGKYLDGLFAFLSTGVFAFLAFDNFEAGHDTRAWVFTGLASAFYAGNIYGSAASANEFNVNVNIAFDSDFRLSLEKRNYFTPAYDFCK